jgi:glutathione S-transferase
MKLYYWPRTRAFTSLWMMEEVGEPYELAHVNLRAPEHPTPEYRAINPMGKLAGLQDGDCAMGETAAILLYLADKYPHRQLAPLPTDPRRGRFLQWLIFPASTLEPAMMDKVRGATTNTLQASWGDYERALGVLESALRPGAWLQDGPFTAADLYIASQLRFGMTFGLIDRRPAFEDLVSRASARPSFARASEIEAREGARLLPAS